MEGNKNMTERLLRLALEFVYLLIEEDYVIVKKSGGQVSYSNAPQCTIAERLSDSRTSERNSEKKILELANKIIHLLTGEDYLQAMNFLDHKIDFQELYNDDEKQNMGRNVLFISQGISSGRTELSKLPPTSVTEYLRKDKIVPVSPHEITSSVNTNLQEDGYLPEVYVHDPIEQTEYLSVCNKGGKASGNSDNVIDNNNVCKPKKENSVEERNSTCQMHGQTKCSENKIIGEPVETEEESFGLNSDLNIPRENLSTLENSSLQLYKESLAEGDQTTPQYMSTYIKQEGDLTETSTSAENTQQLFISIKTEEDSASYTNGDFKDAEIDLAIELSQTQYISTCIKEEFLDSMYNEDYNLHTRSEELSHRGEILHEYYSAHSSNAHQGMETSDKLFSCSECGKCFNYKSLLFLHAKSHQKKLLICGECGKQYSSRTEFEIHQRIHTGEKPFHCSDCGKDLRRNNHMLQHDRTPRAEETFPYPDCGKCFQHLDQHNKIHRTNLTVTAIPMTRDISQDQTTSTAYEEKEVFACTERGKCYNELSLLERHQQSHAGDKPLPVSTPSSYTCPVCGKWFSKRSRFAIHQRSHTGEFSCSQCEKSFTCKGNLVRHQRIHTGKRPFACNDCGKRFFCTSHLARHQRVHTGEKPFSCPECGKCFTVKSSLIKHLLVHTGERPFSCSECGKCYASRDKVVIHQRTHTGEKPFPCSECGKCFSGKTQLLNHLNIHVGQKPFFCSECGKTFARNSHLIRHQRTHTGERPYSCVECGKRFANKANLVTHTRVHSV